MTQVASTAFYRRMRAKHGAPKAVTATARKIAVIVYLMLRDKRAYPDFGAAQYEQQYRERVLNNLERKAKRLGMHLVPIPDTSVS